MGQYLNDIDNNDDMGSKCSLVIPGLDHKLCDQEINCKDFNVRFESAYYDLYGYHDDDDDDDMVSKCC